MSASFPFPVVGHVISAKRIVFLLGAGVSVAAGIPDFRSPGGMYDTLRPELLTATERQVVSTRIFFENQLPYLELRRPFILGTAERRWKPTLGHWFMRLCHDHDKLLHVYTQNIDGLDFHVGLPDASITAVHGSMSRIVCEFCRASYPIDEFRAKVRANVKDISRQDAEAPAESTPISCLSCGRPGVKPATVLYGSSLPAEFDHMPATAKQADLLVVIGTSLTVYPANSTVTSVPDSCPRVVVNREPVGEDLGLCYGDGRDYLCMATVDQVFLDLIDELGWLHELEPFFDGMAEASRQAVVARLESKRQQAK